MKNSELNKIIKEEIKNVNFDLLLNNYADLYENHIMFFQNIGARLMCEYSLNLSDAYESEKCEDGKVKGYQFYDDSGNKHLTVLQKYSDTVKIAPAVTNDKNDLRINTTKRTSGFDARLLSTHVNNILKIVEDYNLKSISFTPAADKYSNARRRLFTSIIANYQDKISDIKTNDNETKIFFN